MVAAALAVVFVVMLAVTAATSRPPAAAVPDFEAHLVRWSAAHDGFDAQGTRLLRPWLKGVYRVARPLAVAGVRPNVVTLWTVWLALVVVALAAAGGAWPLLAALVVVASAAGDALDGAVAQLTDRAGPRGYVLDSAVDRVNEVLFVAAVWVVGAPAWLAVAAAGTFGLQEYVRARAINAGAQLAEVVTVAERPTRVIACAVALGSAGLAPARAVPFATISLAVLLGLTVVGMVQLTQAIRRSLPGRR